MVIRSSGVSMRSFMRWLTIAMCLSGSAWADPEAAPADAQAPPAVDDLEERIYDDIALSTPEKARKWYLILGAVNTYPKLKSEELIDRYFDGVLDLLMVNHDDVKTVGDLRDSYLLWPPQLV